MKIYNEKETNHLVALMKSGLFEGNKAIFERIDGAFSLNREVHLLFFETRDQYFGLNTNGEILILDKNIYDLVRYLQLGEVFV